MIAINKNEAFDEAEKILDTYVNYVINHILTFNEAVEILLASKKVTLFFTEEEIQAVMSYELKKGQTVQ
tara:strand:- start:396 stop:602 length:207 start_codon:yes stop_codon:yes gene_type:complete